MYYVPGKIKFFQATELMPFQSQYKRLLFPDRKLNLFSSFLLWQLHKDINIIKQKLGYDTYNHPFFFHNYAKKKKKTNKLYFPGFKFTSQKWEGTAWGFIKLRVAGQPQAKNADVLPISSSSCSQMAKLPPSKAHVLSIHNKVRKE